MSSANHQGRITSGVSADAAALKTLDFIAQHLVAWRDDPERPPAARERDLNTQLCKFLNVAARSDFGMVHFHHEEPQGVQHAADFSASPVDGGWIEGRQYTKYDPILVMEGKRLPTPGSGREREYVTSAAGKKPGGGMQRFKLGLHGKSLSTAGMVGYVESGDCRNWFDTINQWVNDLASSDHPHWKVDERLHDFVLDQGVRVSRCTSEHPRTSHVSPFIRLTHLWVEMTGN